jgi:anion-transporting  ArsA/GET3 family ATPase
MLYNAVFENRVVRYFLTAAPSLAEIVMLGKVWWHAARDLENNRARWDLVVLDAPATGHGLTFLTVPETFLSLVSEGPLARDMRDMQALMVDPARCSTCIVSLPEEMPANEAIELGRSLQAHKLPLGPLFLNGVFARRFSPEERVAVARAGPQLGAAAEAADAHEARADLSEHYAKFLREQMKQQDLIPIPYLFERTFDLKALDKVGAAIEGAL